MTSRKLGMSGRTNILDEMMAMGYGKEYIDKEIIFVSECVKEGLLSNIVTELYEASEIKQMREDVHTFGTGSIKGPEMVLTLNVPEISEYKPKGKKTECIHCGRKIRTPDAMARHIKTKHKKETS